MSEQSQQQQHEQQLSDDDQKTTVSKSRAVSEEPSATEDKQQAAGGGAAASGADLRGHHAPNRNSNSLRQFTRRFRSFSNDLLRSIESAHDMVDLGNSNLPFAAATQLAAAQHLLAAPSIYLATGALTGTLYHPARTFTVKKRASDKISNHLDNQPNGSAATATCEDDINANELGLSDVREEDNESVLGERTIPPSADKSEVSSVVDKKSSLQNVVATSSIENEDRHENVKITTDKGVEETIMHAPPPLPTSSKPVIHLSGIIEFYFKPLIVANFHLCFTICSRFLY